ncbi:MAG: hypothetical protein QM831_44760 [Kofleriaceae bacterium]
MSSIASSVTPGGNTRIANPPAEPQIENADAITRANGREATPRRDRKERDVRQAQLRVRRAVGHARDGDPQLAELFARTRRPLLREHEQPAIEDDLRIGDRRRRFTEWLAPRFADRSPQPELAFVPEQEPAIGDRHHDRRLAVCRTDGLEPDRIRPDHDWPIGVPDRERRRGGRHEQTPFGVEVIQLVRADHLPSPEREPCK